MNKIEKDLLKRMQSYCFYLIYANFVQKILPFRKKIVILQRQN